MAEFNFDIPNNKGLPQLDNDYWKQSQKDTNEEIALFDTNIKASFVDLKDISVFKG